MLISFRSMAFKITCRNIYSKRGNISSHIPPSSEEVQKVRGVDQFAENYEHGLCQQYRPSSWKKMIRGSLSHHLDSPVNAGRKKKEIKKQGICCRLKVWNFTDQRLEKVDTGSPQKFYGEKPINSALSDKAACRNGNDCQKPISKVGSGTVMILDHSDDDSTASSAGSCSVTNSSYRLVLQKSSEMQEHGYVDDPETSSVSPIDPSLSRKDEMPNELHHLEVDAFRSTLRSLYAFGSLSWEQESLLTNLRLDLHISNDEYLSELKHMMSRS